MNKVLMVICDGLGDRPHPQFGMKTPLSYAKTPTLDRLAGGGAVGLIDPVSPGVRPGSDVATLALFGYDPYTYYLGRGPLEAIGAGLEVRAGDVAFRCNFSTVDNKLIVVDRRAGRIAGETHELAEAIRGIRISGVQVTFKPTISHRAALILRGRGLSWKISDVDPHTDSLPVQQCKPLDTSAAARKTAKIVNEFVKRSHEILRGHPINEARRSRGQPPANIILPRGAGIVPEVTPLLEKYSVKASCVAAVSLIRGIAKLVGMTLINVNGADGSPQTNYFGKAEAAAAALKDNDLVVLHYKGTDVAGHDGDFKLKARVLENVDAAIASLLSRIQQDPPIVVVTGDHATPVSVREHSADPVPILINGQPVFASELPAFSEKLAAKGNLGRLRGLDIMPILVDYIGKLAKYGY